MTGLTFVEPTTAPPTWNILLYGPGGSGKTMGACSAPGPVLVINAEGPGAIRKARETYKDAIKEVTFLGAETLDAVYVYLKKNDDGIQTLVVDSLAEIYSKLLKNLGGDHPKIQHYDDVNKKIENFVKAVRDLPVNVILIAHEEIVEAEGETLIRPLTGGRKLPEKLVGAVDIVAYTGVVPKSEDAPTRWVGQLVEAKGRRAKDRTGVLGEVRDLDMAEWVHTANRPTVAIETSTDKKEKAKA